MPGASTADLYTGVTRGKRLVVLVGSAPASLRTRPEITGISGIAPIHAVHRSWAASQELSFDQRSGLVIRVVTAVLLAANLAWVWAKVPELK